MKPKIRFQDCNTARVRSDGEFDLYWMVVTEELTAVGSQSSQSPSTRKPNVDKQFSPRVENKQRASDKLENHAKSEKHVLQRDLAACLVDSGSRR